MSGGRIERCPSCGRLIIHGQKCVCESVVDLMVKEMQHGGGFYVYPDRIVHSSDAKDEP